MSKIVKYLLTLEIDVEIDDEKEIPEEMNFGRFLEDGNISIYANHGEDLIVGCVEKENRLQSVMNENYAQSTLEAYWVVRYADGVVRSHSRTMCVGEEENVESKLYELKTFFKEFLRQDAICDHAAVGKLEVFEITTYFICPMKGHEEYLDGEENLNFTWNGTWVEEVVE